MTTRTWRIGLFGTFDLQNYGDLLFPLVAESELTERLGAVELVRFSHNTRTPPEWPYQVTSVADFPEIAGDLDAVLIGGGFLIRFDKTVAPGYGPPNDDIHHPTGYWLVPALIALQHGVPLIWNAPGMHCNDVPEWAELLMEAALENSRYVAVRDELSKAALVGFVDDDRITVTPDTGFGIAKLLNEHPSKEFQALRDASGLTGPYIVIQGARGLDQFIAFLKTHWSQLNEYRFLVLPISPVLGDDPDIVTSELSESSRLAFWPNPLVIAELISRSEAVVGFSYHLTITALASGVPVFSPVDLLAGKYTALSAFDGIHSIRRDGFTPDWFLARLGKRPPSRTVVTTLDRLRLHWDRVADAIRAGTGSPSALDRFWQSAPGFFETLVTRQVAATRVAESDAAERKARIDELETRIGELEKLLILARREIVKRDDRISAIQTSPSWRITAPLRAVVRALKKG